MSTDNEQISKVHDKFFKLVFSDQAKVENYLQGTLSKDLKSKTRFETLKLDNNSYVDAQLKEYFSDVVYDVLFGEMPIKICILFEHKTFVPAFPHLQLMKYMVGVWEFQVLNDLTLTPVLPIVIYHGKQKWVKKDFMAYFTSGTIDESLKPYLPNFDYWLTNLKTEPVKNIEENYSLLSLRMAFLLMKFIFDKQLDKHLEEIFAGHENLKKSEAGQQYLQTIVLYLQNSPQLKDKKMKENVNTFLTLNDIIPGTLAWDLIKEKEAEVENRGIEKGIERGIKETAKNAIKEGLSIDLIGKLTGLSVIEIKKIKKELGL
jgi:predicted transposase/invertase (TIGR01784 family)